MRIQVVLKKTLEDLSSPKFLAGFLIPFAVLTILISWGLTYSVPENFATLPLRTQERELTILLYKLTHLWLAGIPAMALIAIASANYIGREEEDGTMRTLLSKPIRRWEVIMGKSLAIFLFSSLVIVTGLFLGSILIFRFAEASYTAIGGSILSLMPVHIIYALLISYFVTCLGTAFAILTGSRLKTALSVIALAFALTFGFGMLFVEPLQNLGIYEDYLIYTIDVNHHLGNSYLFIANAIKGNLTPVLQKTLKGGMFNASNARIDPLIGGMPPSLPLVDYARPAASFIGIPTVSTGILIYSIRKFEKKDIL